MPPTQDLRGGNASEDSLVISIKTLATSANRRFLAANRQRVEKRAQRIDDEVSHRNLV